jgi:hypothetical protein
MQCHHLQSLEYLAIVQTSFGPWILALHKKNRKPARPPTKEAVTTYKFSESLNEIPSMLWTNQVNVV